jgi:hypothetical protein
MKTDFSILTVLALIILSSCMGNYSSDKIISPSGKYYLITTVNRTDKSKDDYAYVMLSLFSMDGQLITNFNTKAGDANKWAIGWDIKMDTIIMNSSDIGVYAWRIESSEIRELRENEMTESIKEQAKEISANKYKKH